MMNFFQSNSLDGLKGVARKKYRTKQRIIKCLLLHGESTCNWIAQNISLSVPSVQANMNELIKDGFIEEKGQGFSTGGRRPNIYGLKRDSFYILCIDVGRFEVRLAMVDSQMNIVIGIVSHEIKFQDDFSYLEEVCKLTDNFIDTSSIKKEKVIGIGLDMPGLIDSKKGVNLSYFYNPEEVLAVHLQKRFNLPVFLENDSNSLALAERWYGEVRDKENAIVLLLSWGIGMGLIINGELYVGASGFAGEFSHIPSVENGNLCWCNKQGCLETVASATALSNLVKEGVRSGLASSIFKSVNGNEDHIDPGIVIDAAHQGDQFAIKILSDVGYELGKGIATLIQVLNPEIIVLGGRMARARQFLITPIQHALHTHCNPILINNLNIRTTNFGNEAAILGSAILVADRLL